LKRSVEKRFRFWSGNGRNLAEHLLCSLGAWSEAEIEQLWLQGAARRADELAQGSAMRVSAADVRRQAQALLK